MKEEIYLLKNALFTIPVCFLADQVAKAPLTKKLKQCLLIILLPRGMWGHKSEKQLGF